ncbi:MAG: hypothetical protein ACI8QD_000539 [Cyclobacteriaceae bacterium]|jgi:hypothetical protein
MKKLMLILFLFVTGASAKSADTTEIRVPKHILWFDLLNFQDNYPAILVAYEYQLNKDLSIHQEFGPVILPEAYEGVDFDQYLGFKGRTEARLYLDYNHVKRARYFFGVDVAYQLDQYTGQFQRDRGNFTQIENGKFSRSSVGTHLRFGYQRFFSSDRILFSTSIGFGRSFVNVKYPEGYTWSEPGNSITEWPVLDPFSANLRLKLGFVLGKKKT